MAWEHLKYAKWFDSADDAVDYVHELYNKAVSQICDNFSEFEKSGEVPDDHAEFSYYPFIGVSIGHDDLFVDPSFAYGVINEPGHYGTTVTAPELYDAYFREQISLIIERHRVSVVVGYSDCKIPLPFVIEHSHAQFDVDELMRLRSKFVLPDLKRIDDSFANATFVPDGYRPLALFTGERVDFSLQRLHHYTGTPPNHFQNFILLTNYQRYIDEFISQTSHIIEHHQKNDWWNGGSLVR
jgi:AMP nucleosidase